MLTRLKNAGTLVTIASLIIAILTVLEIIPIDSEKVMTVVYLVCGLGVTLGVLNNPTSDGLDLPGVNYPVFPKKPIDKEPEEK